MSPFARSEFSFSNCAAVSRCGAPLAGPEAGVGEGERGVTLGGAVEACVVAAGRDAAVGSGADFAWAGGVGAAVFASSAMPGGGTTL